MNNLSAPFKKLSKKDVLVAGGKGASLGEMTQVGIPVPDGFVLLADAFERFLAETDLNVEIEAILNKVKHKELETVERASERIRGLILNAGMPTDIAKKIKSEFKKLNSTYVAVRSSATAEDGSADAWAGQLDSYLNTTQENLLDNVQKCWASLFTPRAIFYRIEKGLHKEKISVAVVVQKMIQSEVSGIAFSVHPVTEDPNQLIIEAGYGLGEAIVSGQITPDSYVLHKDNFQIVDKNVNDQRRALKRSQSGNSWISIPKIKSNKQKLTDKEIVRLAKLVSKIEHHYSFPVDVEWAKEKGKFFIVQSRPITTLSGACKTEGPELESSKFDKEDYVLSFWVQGVSIFVTDIHLDVYSHLGILFIIDKGVFKQYFLKSKYKNALNEGLKFYSDKNAVRGYKKDLQKHCDDFDIFFKTQIKGKKKISQNVLRKFFWYTSKLVGDYTKMNFEYTDKAFASRKQNKTIEKNLAIVSKFKDEVRAVMNQALFESNGYLPYIWSVLAKQFSVSSSLLDNSTQEEILGLYEGQYPDASLVMKRQDAFVYSYKSKVSFEGKEAKGIVKRFEEKIESSEVLKGQTASPGKIIGTAKIIPVDYSNLNRVNKEIEKMRQGDILVAETTAPELIVACRKAGAIVTDMGGLMSHAAIVSRELGIPCVVGTRYGSKVFKDGDRIEVDGNNGIVRLLSGVVPHLKLSNYQRLFKVDNMPYLISEIFGGHYKDFGCVLTFSGSNWITFLPKPIIEKTLSEGLDLYGSKTKFEEYKQSFESYKKISLKYFKNLDKKLSYEQSTQFLDICIKFFWFYSKTEFFYTDKAFEKSTQKRILKENLQRFEHVKNSGREFLNALYFGKKSYLFKFLSILGKQFSISVNDLFFYSQTELLDLFAKKKLSKSDIKNRKQSYFMQGIDGHLIMKAGSEAEDIVKSFLNTAKEFRQQIKGIIANKGLVEGRVKVIDLDFSSFDQLKREINKMKQGDILVAETTSPELMAACKKAGAIVTNQGGLMSHAAIVSREFNIPCIVGTGNITEIVKDGDLVKVDANNGIVKVMSRAK